MRALWLARATVPPLGGRRCRICPTHDPDSFACANISPLSVLRPRRFTLPPEPDCFGRKPMYEANARPDRTTLASPIVAIAVVAIILTRRMVQQGHGLAAPPDRHYERIGD